jgi:heptosyltransferase-1
MRVLIVKTSSLGDLVHTLPAVSDAVRAVPGIRFDWLAERGFAEIPAWHPAVERIIASDLRRWRGSPSLFFGSEWREFRTRLRQDEYDLVLDAQGLVKSAWLASRARGPLAGPDWASAREPLASLFYQYKLPFTWDVHAVQRGRVLFAGALGYELPEAAPDFGIDRSRLPASAYAQPYVVLLHATTWPTKRWAEGSWQELGRWLASQGMGVLLPWGNADEQAAAQRIAEAFGGTVLPRLALTPLAGVLARARAVIGVDTGLAHVAAALGTPSVTLYGPTLPGLTGTIGERQQHLCSTDATTIDRARPTTVAVARVQEALAPWLATS